MATPKQKQAMGMAVIAAVLANLFAHGMQVRYFDGEECGDWANNIGDILPLLCACDEEWIQVLDGNRRVGTMLLVWGNDGYDVIADHSVALAEFIDPVVDPLVAHFEALRARELEQRA